MTLILSVAAPPVTVQASDRLLTQQPLRAQASAGNRYVTFDDVANKSILYRARDAVVSISYSGPAFVGETPTDQFVVETLIGERLSAWISDPVMQFGRTKTWWDIGSAIGALCQAFSEVANRQRFEVGVVGWQWQKKATHARPVAWVLTNGAGDTTMRPDRPLPRRWYLPLRQPNGELLHKVYLRSCGVSMPDAMSESLRQALGRNNTQYDAMRLMANAIASVAATPGTPVGRDVLMISIPHPRYQQIDVFFHSPEGRTLELWRNGEFLESCELGFSPWIVSGDLVAAPAIHVGCFRQYFGPYTIEVHAPDPPPGNHLRRAVIQQRRRPINTKHVQTTITGVFEDLTPIPDPPGNLS